MDIPLSRTIPIIANRCSVDINMSLAARPAFSGGGGRTDPWSFFFFPFNRLNPELKNDFTLLATFGEDDEDDDDDKEAP